MTTNSTSLEYDIRQLRKEFSALGILTPDRRAYIIRTCWILPIYFLGWTILLDVNSLSITLFVCIAIAISSVQSAAISHEAAHGAVTNNKNSIYLIGYFFMNFLMGSSYSNWTHKHNLHHANANSRKDPDLKAGIFCFNEQDASNARGMQRLFTRHQHFLIWPLATLMGFSFKIRSLQYIIKNPNNTRTDQWVLLLHFIFWLFLPSFFISTGSVMINYLIITWIEGIYLAFIFLTNHMGRPAAETLVGKGSASRQIICSRNIKYSWFLNVICNGLISHIEHHLYCNISYTKLHLVRPYIRNLCVKFDLPYHEVSLFKAFTEFAQHNKRMALIARGSTNQQTVTD